MSDGDIYIERNGIALAKVKEDGRVVDGLTEQDLSDKQKESVRKLTRIV